MIKHSLVISVVNSFDKTKGNMNLFTTSILHTNAARMISLFSTCREANEQIVSLVFVLFVDQAN